jgi:IMP dehydrogenase
MRPNSEKRPINISEKMGLTFDDVLLEPGYSEVLPHETDTATHLGHDCSLKIPVLSAAMDSVTEEKMAESMARLGGIGIIHKNMSPERQSEAVQRVKRLESGVVADPITISPDTSVEEILEMMHQRKISGLPVLDESKKLVGLICRRDVRFEKDPKRPAKQLMTPYEKLVTLQLKDRPDNARFAGLVDDARKLLHEFRVEKIPIVDSNQNLLGLVTLRDIENTVRFPLATKDRHGRLMVGAAVGPSQTELEIRVPMLIAAGVDLLVLDTAHGHSRGVIEATKRIKSIYGDNILLVAGNIATASAARALSDAGADVVKVGIGPGSICTTRIVAGIGVPQLSAICEVCSALANTKTKIIADGGIRYSGDIVKALAAGADAVMLGGLLAGTEEAPGERVNLHGKAFKKYRGMGSLGAMRKGSKDRYFQEKSSDQKLVPEGIEGQVPYRGHVTDVIHQLVGGLRSGMGYVGAKNLHELCFKASFIRITPSAVRESHVHDVIITDEAPNYSRYQD